MKNESPTKKVIFEPFKAEGRIIYPVVDILFVNEYLNILNVSPVALIIEEKDDTYILQLNHDQIDEEELFELFHPLSKNYKI